MNIRFFNNITQNVKCNYYLLTKVNQNSNDFSKHILLKSPFLWPKQQQQQKGATKIINRATTIIGATTCRRTSRDGDVIKPILNNSERIPTSFSIVSSTRKGNMRIRFDLNLTNESTRRKVNICQYSTGSLCLMKPISDICFDKDVLLLKGSSLQITRKNLDECYDNGKGGNKQYRKYHGKKCGNSGLFVAAFTFNFFGLNRDEESDDPTEKLVTQIKRSILCIQREQYDKAEQMLHLALRMAQDIQSKEGITYIYDLMANLAMEREQYPKAEKLFADVLKRLFADGHGEDSAQVLHISSKLAHMAQLQGELEKAHQGFVWTLERIGQSIKNLPEDKDLQELFGLTKNWFGQLLMKQGKYVEAKKHFEAAHSCLTDVYGDVNEAAITILNNLSVACVNMDDFVGAKDYLNKALDLVKELKDSTQEGILYANLGIIYLREGLTHQARQACSLAYRIGKQQNNPDAIEQAEYCLNEIKSCL